MNGPLRKLITEVSELVQDVSGIQLGENQTNMVQFRLSRRMSELNLDDPEDYLDFVRDNLEDETKVLVSLLTTHHTFFFREFSHFEYLEKTGLPLAIAEARKENRKVLKLWSAAASRGHEAYSLALFLRQYLDRAAPDFQFEILGTDIDHESIEVAKNGVYRWAEIKEIPSIYAGNHIARGTGDIADFAKMKGTIKQACRFKELNLFKVTPEEPFGNFDFVFCRNVFIYFNPDQIATITKSLMMHLFPHGHLFIGVSESLNGLKLPLANCGPSIYVLESWKQKEAARVANTAATSTNPTKQVATPSPTTSPRVVTNVAAASKTSSQASPLRVLCVDDSPTVLMLLKKILTPEHGFQIVATAENGLKAAEMIKKEKIDVVTLDIHMPEQDGISYLRQNFKAGHPPVVMVSSVSREDSDLGIKAFEYGANDYVEKPSLQNLTKKADEIRMKLKLAAANGARASKPLELVKSFERSAALKNGDGKLRVLIASLGDFERVKQFLSQCSSPQPATFVLLHGSEAMAPALAKKISCSFGHVEACTTIPTQLKANSVFVGDFLTLNSGLKQWNATMKASCLVFGDITDELASQLLEWAGAQLIVEDMANPSKGHQKLREIASYCIPLTSYLYHSDEFLAAGDK